MTLELKFWPDPADPSVVEIDVRGFKENLRWSFEDGAYAWLVVGVEAEEMAELPNRRVALDVTVELKDDAAAAHGTFVRQSVSLTRTFTVPQFPSVEEADKWMNDRRLALD